MAQTTQLGRHATTVATENGWTRITYHQTVVVKFNQRTVVLNSGGWMTATTKTRMNQASNQFDLGFQVFQKDFGWFVERPDGETVDFGNGMEFGRTK